MHACMQACMRVRVHAHTHAYAHASAFMYVHMNLCFCIGKGCRKSPTLQAFINPIFCVCVCRVEFSQPSVTSFPTAELRLLGALTLGSIMTGSTQRCTELQTISSSSTCTKLQNTNTHIVFLLPNCTATQPETGAAILLRQSANGDMCTSHKAHGNLNKRTHSNARE